MKKLLILLALCMVVSVALVACNNNGGGDDTTPGEVTTDPGTTDPGTTDTEPGTTDTEPGTTDTEPGTTDTESDTEPTPPEPVKVIVGKSWDSLRKINGAVEGEFIFADGYAYLEWEKNAVAEIGLNDTALNVFGWVAFFTETEGTVGYKINDGEIVYGEGFTSTAEPGVQEAIKGIPGALSACRMHFDIPTTDLAAGEHTFALYAKDPAGNEELIKEFKVTKTLPFVDIADATDFNEWSFDGFYVNDELYFAEDGMAASKLEAQDKLVSYEYGQYVYNMAFRGWVSFKQTVDSFGYYIAGATGNDIVYGEFIQERLDLVGIKENGTGYNIFVPAAELTYGQHKVGFVAKLADGTVVRLFEFTLELKNLSVSEDTNFHCSIDHVNGCGPLKEDGSYGPYYEGVGGPSIGKIDAAADKKTNDKNGILSLGGWIAIEGGVKGYVWSVDGGNTWNEVYAGGGDERTDLATHFTNLGYTDAAVGAYAFSGANMIQIDLSVFPAGVTGTVLVGAIPNNAPSSIVVFAEVADITVAPVVETIYFNGENGTFTVPANFETKFSIMNAANKTIKIENAFNYVVTATNGIDTFTLQPDMLGTIEVTVPDGFDWFMVELTITNITEEAVEVTVQVADPVIGGEGTGTPDDPYVMTGTEGTISAEIITGWDTIFYTFTAEADGVLTFNGPANMSVFVEDAYGSEWLFDGNGTYAVTAGNTYKFFIAEANYTAGTIEGTWSFGTGASEPAEPVVGSADFNTIVTSNANGDSKYSNSYTTDAGWTTVNSAIQCGGSAVSNPQFPVIGADNTFKAVCLNGKVSAPGKLTSPTLTGGLSKITMTYTKMFTDTALSVTITVTDLATGEKYEKVVERTVAKDDDKYVVWTEEWVLDTPITGDYTIEVTNNCPSQNTGNKDRFTILSLTYESAV